MSTPACPYVEARFWLFDGRHEDASVADEPTLEALKQPFNAGFLLSESQGFRLPEA